MGVALWAPISTPPPQPPRARTSPTWRGGPRPRGQPPAGAPDVPGGDVQRRRHPGGPHHGQGLAQEVAVPVVKGQGDQRVGGPPSAPPHVGELADGDRAEAGFPDSLDLLGETGWWHGEVREAAARPSRNAVVHEDRHRSPRGGGAEASCSMSSAPIQHHDSDDDQSIAAELPLQPANGAEALVRVCHHDDPGVAPGMSGAGRVRSRIWAARCASGLWPVESTEATGANALTDRCASRSASGLACP